MYIRDEYEDAVIFNFFLKALVIEFDGELLTSDLPDNQTTLSKPLLMFVNFQNSGNRGETPPCYRNSGNSRSRYKNFSNTPPCISPAAFRVHYPSKTPEEGED